MNTDQESATNSTADDSLYKRALLAWRRELEKLYQSIEADKRSEIRQGVFRKLVTMFGPGHLVELEDKAKSTEVVVWAMVEELRFMGLKAPSGEIGIHLLVRCPSCGYEMAGDKLASLADLGRELVELSTKGIIGEHECPQ